MISSLRVQIRILILTLYNVNLFDNKKISNIFRALLKDFPYSLRDDGLLYWDAIEEYVTSVVDFFFDNSKEAVYFGKTKFKIYLININ